MISVFVNQNYQCMDIFFFEEITPSRYNQFLPNSLVYHVFMKNYLNGREREFKSSASKGLGMPVPNGLRTYVLDI